MEDFSRQLISTFVVFTEYGLAIISGCLVFHLILKAMAEEKKELPDQTPAAEIAPNVKDILLAALLRAYSPHENDGPLELKSTLDIMEEMSSVADIEKWTIQMALVDAGFDVHYAGNCFLWKMYKAN